MTNAVFHHVAISCKDMAKTERFYSSILASVAPASSPWATRRSSSSALAISISNCLPQMEMRPRRQPEVTGRTTPAGGTSPSG